MTNPKLWCSALFLASLVGCAGEEAPTPAPAPKVTAPETKPAPAPAPKVEAPKAEPKPEMAPKPEPKVEAPKAEPKADEAPKVEGPKADAKASKLTDDEIAEIKKLPADEAAIALKQIVCPASDENLGGMGVPVKVTAEGRTFFLCCKSCEKDVKANPKEILAKLPK